MSIHIMSQSFTKNLLLWGIAGFAVMAVLLYYVTKTHAIVTVLHGATIAKGCNSPKQPGETVQCDIQVGYNDQAGDTISIDEAWDVEDYGGDNVRVPAVGNLPITAVSGNTTCAVAGSLPCKIGPSGSTLNGLPGTASAGSVTFHSGTYIVQADDPNPIPDQGNAKVHDLCDDPNTTGCSSGSNTIQFTSSTNVVTPTPTPTNTPTPTPTNTPTPTPTNTPSPTPTNTPTPTPRAGCTLTQGYWKNHASAWPVSSLTLGTVNYTKAQLLSILNAPVKGNGLISLAHQLIAAKLNIANGASSGSIASTITSATTLIGGKVIPPVGSGFLSPNSASSLTKALDNFNTGVTGPGHCPNKVSSRSTSRSGFLSLATIITYMKQFFYS